ncbi:MAG TPA: nuclear transport factor 2 family protein [Thermoleophilaceae bacterium]|jgi:steroid delta-isomerase-like uncharacterized protein|nr:nuclear transport factor 2 family protein [Thermoleophilaceae bacterium]
MAQAKSTGRGDRKKSPAAKKPAAKAASGAKKATVAQNDTQTKPPRRRISRRKAVEEHTRAYFDSLARRDGRALAAYWSEDAIADIAPLGTLRGREEIAGLFGDLFAAMPDLETTVTRLVPGEHEAVVEWRMTGHFTGRPFQGVEPTGKLVELRGIDLIEIADGKNTSLATYYDGMSFARQIGLMPAQDSGPERAMKGALNAATKLRRAVNARRGGG